MVNGGRVCLPGDIQSSEAQRQKSEQQVVSSAASQQVNRLDSLNLIYEFIKK